MKRSGLIIATVLSCMSLTAAAQVSRNGEASSTPTPVTPVTEPPPKPPTYTPEQLFGTRESPTVSPPNTSGASASPPNTNTSGTSVPQPVSTPPSATTTPAPASSPQPCSVPAPTATQFPGVSASQLPRAGVSAEAFTRPGVSAAELNALRPGARSSPCAPPRQVHLYPEPAEQPRPILTTADE